MAEAHDIDTVAICKTIAVLHLNELPKLMEEPDMANIVYSIWYCFARTRHYTRVVHEALTFLTLFQLSDLGLSLQKKVEKYGRESERI